MGAYRSGHEGPAWWSRLRRAGPLLAALVATLVLLATHALGERPAGLDDFEGRQLRLMAPADPGGGWDQTSREIQAALRDQIGRVEVYNVGGAGGTIGLSQYVQLPPDPTELMVTGLIMVGAVQTNHSPVSLRETTPLARLTTDYEVVVVPADSPLRTVDDLIAAMRRDLRSVSVAGGSAGGVEQILAGLIADEIGADPSKVNYIAHSGGGEMLTTLLSGRASAAISGLSEILPQIEAGRVRALAVSSAERLRALPDVPTLRERGVDVELSNWRGIVAPAGISASEERALEDMLTRMSRSPQWQEALRTRGWGDAFLTGPRFERFIDAERRRVGTVLEKLGLR